MLFRSERPVTKRYVTVGYAKTFDVHDRSVRTPVENATFRRIKPEEIAERKRF